MGAFFVVKLLVVVRVHLQVMESKLLLNPFLESLALLQRKGVCLGDNGNNVDHVRKLLENHNVDGLE